MRVKIDTAKKYGTLEILIVVNVIKSPAVSRAYHYYPEVACKCSCGKIVTRKKKALVAGDTCHCGELECKRKAFAIKKGAK